MKPRASKPSATRPGCGSIAPWCGPACPACRSASCRLAIPASTLSHHLKTLIVVGLVTQERDGTSLICRTSYPVMRGLVNFLVAECCSEAGCSGFSRTAERAA